MSLIPSEFNLYGVFMPPLLVAAVLGMVATWITASLLNRFRISRWFFYPPLVYASLVVIFTVAFGSFIIPS